jgi:hypothetical protein
MDPLGYLFQSATSAAADHNGDGNESSSGLPPQEQELSPNNSKGGSCSNSNSNSHSNSYEILGCAEGASPEEVKHAYQRAAGPVRVMSRSSFSGRGFWWGAKETRRRTFSDAVLSFLSVFLLASF